jgi:hypothetical protein
MIYRLCCSEKGKPKSKGYGHACMSWGMKEEPSYIILHFSILLHCIDLTWELLCHLSATSFTIRTQTVPRQIKTWGWGVWLWYKEEA